MGGGAAHGHSRWLELALIVAHDISQKNQEVEGLTRPLTQAVPTLIHGQCRAEIS